MDRRRFLSWLGGLAGVGVLAHHKPGHHHDPTTTTATTLPATTTTTEPMPTTTVRMGMYPWDALVLVADSNATAQGKITAAASTAVIGFEPGVHYERKVTPKLGQTLRGHPGGGTIFDGSREVTGWTGSNPWVATHAIADRGVFTEAIRSADLGTQYPEELFYETPGTDTGWTRKTRTGTPGTTTPAAGKWTMSYSAGTLRVAEDPTATAVRVSVTDRAIVSPGTGTGGVTIEDITFRKYATDVRICPWADGNSPDHRDWTLRRLRSWDCHGAGAALCPGDTASNLQVGYAGQIGFMAGCNMSGYSNGWELLDSEVYRNMQAPFDWGWEGGGSKFESTPNTGVAKPVVIRNCWFHHNRGPGIWADVNETVTGHSLIESNLSEDNEGAGIFWEISAGTTTIRWNRFLRNGAGSVTHIGGPTPSGDSAVGIDLSNSRGVLVVQNVSDGSPAGVMVRDDGRSPFLDGCEIRDNSSGRRCPGGT